MCRRELEDGCKMTMNCKLLNSKLPSQYPVATELLTLAFEINKDYSMFDRVSSSAKKRMSYPSHTTLQPYVLQDASFFYAGILSFEFSTFWKNLPKQAYKENFVEIFFLDSTQYRLFAVSGCSAAFAISENKCKYPN